MIKKTSIITALVSAFTLTTAFAADGINARTGFYIGGGVADNFVSYRDSSGQSWIGGGDIALIPIAGYRFTDDLALEWNYNSLQDDNTNSDGIWGPSHHRMWTTSLAGKFIRPWGNGLSVYSKAGFAVTHLEEYSQLIIGSPPIYDIDETRVQPLLGVGVSYNFTQSLAIDLGLSYQFQTGNIPNIDPLTLGFTYTF